MSSQKNLKDMLAGRNFASEFLARDAFKQNAPPAPTVGLNPAMIHEPAGDMDDAPSSISLEEHARMLNQVEGKAREESYKLGFRDGYEKAQEENLGEDRELIKQQTEAIQFFLAEYQRISSAIIDQENNFLEIIRVNILEIMQTFLPEYLEKRTKAVITKEITDLHDIYRQAKLVIRVRENQYDFVNELLQNKLQLPLGAYELSVRELSDNQLEIDYDGGGVNIRAHIYENIMANIKNKIAQYRESLNNINNGNQPEILEGITSNDQIDQ